MLGEVWFGWAMYQAQSYVILIGLVEVIQGASGSLEQSVFWDDRERD